MMAKTKWVLVGLGLLMGMGVCYAQGGESALEGGKIPQIIKIALERKGYNFVYEGGQASIISKSPAPTFSPLFQINTGTASGFGSGDYPYWEIGSDIRSISVQPGGLVLGYFDHYPIRFNPATKDYELADWFLNPQDINPDMIIDNGRGEIIACGSFVSASSPTWIHRYRSSDFTFISSMTIPAIPEKIRFIEDMVVSPAGDIILSGAIVSFKNLSATPFIKKISSDFSSTIDLKFNHLGGVIGVKFDANGVMYAVGFIDDFVGEEDASIWIGKYNSAFQLMKDISYGPSRLLDAGFSLALGSNNDIYIAGMVSEKPWIGRYKSNLDFISSSKLHDFPNDGYGMFDQIVVANNGVFVTGSREPSERTESDMLMVEYTKDLSYKSQHSIGNSDGYYDVGDSIASDGKGRIYIGGYIHSETEVRQFDPTRKGWLSIHSFSAGEIIPDEETDNEDGNSDNDITNNNSGNPLAFPNPFRPGKGHTALSIDNLPETGTLKLFTLKGELVREIPVAAGSASWDVKNTAGENVSSGVYFGVVDGQDSDKTFKVVIQR